MSLSSPRSQTNVRVCTPRLKMEKGSGIPLSETPTACPALLTEIPKLSLRARNCTEIDHFAAYPENSPVLRESDERVDNAGLRCTQAPSAVVDRGGQTAVTICKCAEVAHDSASPAIRVSHETVRIKTQIRRKRISDPECQPTTRQRLHCLATGLHRH